MSEIATSLTKSTVVGADAERGVDAGLLARGLSQYGASE
jgi:hypothetical protein